MGQHNVARVDVLAIYGAARGYDTTADIVDAAVRTHLTGLAFDGGTAGRDHVASGDAVRMAVDDVVDRLPQWSRAAREIAAALRASADRYTDADARAANRLG